MNTVEWNFVLWQFCHFVNKTNYLSYRSISYWTWQCQQVLVELTKRKQSAVPEHPVWRSRLKLLLRSEFLWDEFQFYLYSMDFSHVFLLLLMFHIYALFISPDRALRAGIRCTACTVLSRPSGLHTVWWCQSAQAYSHTSGIGSLFSLHSQPLSWKSRISQQLFIHSSWLRH